MRYLVMTVMTLPSWDFHVTGSKGANPSMPTFDWAGVGAPATTWLHDQKLDPLLLDMTPKNMSSKQ